MSRVRVNRLDASIKDGEIYGNADAARDFFAFENVRKNLAVLGGFFGLILIAFGAYFHGVGRMESEAEDTISRTISAVRVLYGAKADVGSSSVIIPIILSKPYLDGTVQVKWLDGSVLDVKNDFGGKLDVIGRGNHFELLYYAVPAGSCVKLISHFAKSGMPVFVNTIPYQGAYDGASLEKACYAEVNNIVWKFR